MVFMTYANVVFSYGTAAPEHIGAYVKKHEGRAALKLAIFSHSYKNAPVQVPQPGGGICLFRAA